MSSFIIDYFSFYLRELENQLTPNRVMEQRSVVADTPIQHRQSSEVAAPAVLSDVWDSTACAACLHKLLIAMEFTNHFIL